MDKGLEMTLEAMARAAREGRAFFSEAPSGEMDSDVVATFLAGLLKQAGADVRFRYVSQRPGREFHHVFVEVYYPAAGLWLPLDPHQAREKWAKEGTKDI